MMSRTRTSLISALTVSFALLAPVNAATSTTAALGDDGSIYRVLSGPYGDLFPDGQDTGADHVVLALEINHAEGERELWLVPETTSPAAEVAPSLMLDKPTGTLYLLWEGLPNHVHAVLHLASHTTSDGWSSVLEITGNPYTRKAAPQLVVTRDNWRRFEPPMPPETFERVTLHISWWEETAAGSRKWYTPIVIENGRHLSWMPSWNLSNFLPTTGDPVFTEPHTALRIQRGWNDRTIMVGFLSTEGEQLATVEVEVLPGELDSLADWARIQIINGVLDPSDPAAAEFAILSRGAEMGFHPASLAAIAAQARSALESSDAPQTPAGLDAVATKARLQIINGGVKIGAIGMLDQDVYEILEIERPDNPDSRHLLKASVQSVRQAPEGIGPSPRLFLSERGKDVIIGWEIDGGVAYYESAGEGWAPLRTIVLNDDLDADAAFLMLEARARGH